MIAEPQTELVRLNGVLLSGGSDLWDVFDVTSEGVAGILLTSEYFQRFTIAWERVSGVWGKRFVYRNVSGVNKLVQPVINELGVWK
jgi:hypothetical protein